MSGRFAVRHSDGVAPFREMVTGRLIVSKTTTDNRRSSFIDINQEKAIYQHPYAPERLLFRLDFDFCGHAEQLLY